MEDNLRLCSYRLAVNWNKFRKIAAASEHSDNIIYLSEL